MHIYEFKLEASKTKNAGSFEFVTTNGTGDMQKDIFYHSQIQFPHHQIPISNNKTVFCSHVYCRQVYNRVRNLRNSNASAMNGKGIISDRSTDPLALNAHTMSADEVSLQS